MRLLRGLAVVVLLVCAGLFAWAPAPADRVERPPCAPGYRYTSGRGEFPLPAGADPALRGPGEPEEVEPGRPSHEERRRCVPQRRPESFSELAVVSAYETNPDTAPFSSIHPDAYAAAVAETRAMAGAPADVANSAGQFVQIGDVLHADGLAADGNDFPNSVGRGFTEHAGRVSDLARVGDGDTIVASVADGGVWLSDDLGDTWRSIGDGLPTQKVGSVDWTPSGGADGTIIALTGDNSLSSAGVAGVGAFFTTDAGATWQRASGLPNAALGMQLAVDPGDPDIIYAATSKGLWRSTDAGRSYVNTDLPTLDCAGAVDVPRCFYANVVTDVVVNADGGEVLAGVGWRAALLPNTAGNPQAPANGMYRSPTGAPGSFARVADADFPENETGRIELGAATGPNQDHDVVFALVQDAQLFNSETNVVDLPDPTGLTTIIQPTFLRGLYVSTDFGDTWTELASGADLIAQSADSSSLLISSALGVGPGYQAWYNLYVAVDPTRQDSEGIPTRLSFGLEEVWQNRLEEVGVPLDGSLPVAFEVIGRYYGGDSCIFNVPEGVPCSNPVQAPTTTHPDQHTALWIPSLDGGVTLLVGDDGGVFRQTAGPGVSLDNANWGRAANTNFATLLYYDVAMAADGVAYGGLQDNGTAFIDADGTQYESIGGDGTLVAVDPSNSDYAWSSTPQNGMSVTTDGGRTWRSVFSPVSDPQFVSQFVMDPLDANHLLQGGSDIYETVLGPLTEDDLVSADDDWQLAFDLGTRDQPGNASAEASDADPFNQTSAMTVRGAVSYVGFCSSCIVTGGSFPFTSGVATNEGGTWHIPAATGLPERYVTAVTVDPDDPRTVYVTLGGYGRRWTPPGALEEPTPGIGVGHVFRSTDGGESFTDISANLPDAPANALEVRGDQLVVGTETGVFLSRDRTGAEWDYLEGLPTVEVTGLSLKPGDASTLVVATFGRGLWLYRFAGTPPVVAPPTPTRPVALPATGAAGPPVWVLSAAALAALCVLVGTRSRTPGKGDHRLLTNS